MKIATALILLLAANAWAQEPGGRGRTPAVAPDTNVVFASPRPLIEPLNTRTLRRAWGIDILFSNSGYGVGTFYRYAFNDDVTGFALFFVSGARNGDEFYTYNYYLDSLIGPPGKVNNLIIIPFSVGVQYRLFRDALSESFRPYINAGVGPAILMAAPAQYEFFTSLGHASFYGAPDAFIGLGVSFGHDKHSVMGVNFRYYYIPYPRGLESIQGQPITDFGGLFLTLNWGLRF